MKRKAGAHSALKVVLLLCGAEVLSMTGFAAYPALLPLLRKEWGLSASEAGMISGVFFAGYMVATPILVGLTDRLDTRRIYLVATLLAALGSFGFAFFAKGLYSAMLFQALVGAGLAGTYMPGLRLLTDHFHGAVPSRGVAFYTATFGIGTTVSLLLAGVLESTGWFWVFVVAGTGPIVAGILVFLSFPPKIPVAVDAPRALLFDFRPILKNPEAMRYILGYAAHCWELFGLRSWLPAFFAFSIGFSGSSGGVLLGAAALAAWINLLGPTASILGNEAAIHKGRKPVITLAMTGSGVLACLVGFSAPLPLIVVFTITAVYFLLIMGDSAALTAGLVASVPAERRGAAMALHSLLGFGAGFLAPLTFGLVLDLAGGTDRVLAWGLAFAALGFWSLVTVIVNLLRKEKTPPVADQPTAG